MTPTPKEKALKLLQKFGWLGRKWVQTNYTTLHFENAKQCSLVCVNEMIIQNGEIYLLQTNEELKGYYTKKNGWLFEVKTEIENFTL